MRKNLKSGHAVNKYRTRKYINVHNSNQHHDNHDSASRHQLFSFLRASALLFLPHNLRRVILRHRTKENNNIAKNHGYRLNIVPFATYTIRLRLLCLLCPQSVDKEILDVLPKIKEAKNIVGLMDRETLTFDVALQRTEDEVSERIRSRLRRLGA